MARVGVRSKVASYTEKFDADGKLTSVKVYWTMPRALVPAGQKKATGSLTVYSRKDCIDAVAIAERHKHHVTGDQVAAELMQRRQEEGRDSSNVMTLEKWYQIWIGGLNPSEELSQRQIETYAGQFTKVILPARPLTIEKREEDVLPLGVRPLTEIEPLAIRKLYQSLRQKPLSANTVKSYHAALRACLNVAIANPSASGITSNPVAGIKFSGKKTDDDDREPEKYFEPEQYSLILESIPADSRLFVKFLCETGMRFSEVTALTVRDLDFETNVVTIDSAHKRSYSGKLLPVTGTPKGKSDRWGEVPPSVMSEVRFHIERHGYGDKDLIFRAPAGGKMHHSNFLNRRWNLTLLRLSWCPIHPPQDKKLPSRCSCLGDASWTGFRPHALRHTWATWQFLIGTPIEFISRQLGHPDTKFTERQYVHLRKSRPTGIGSKLDTFLGR